MRIQPIIVVTEGKLFKFAGIDSKTNFLRHFDDEVAQMNVTSDRTGQRSMTVISIDIKFIFIK